MELDNSKLAGCTTVEALRAEQLLNYLNKIKEKHEKVIKTTLDTVKHLQKNIKNLGVKPIDISNLTPSEQMKKLNKQMDQINIKLILQDKNLNEIKDRIIKGIKIRYQLIKGFPSKELRSLIDQGKKDLKKGIVVVYTIVDEKVGVAVGVTNDFTKKYNAVELVKLGSTVIGGTGGGGRNDFAQAGGNLPEKIEESFQKIIEKI